MKREQFEIDLTLIDFELVFLRMKSRKINEIETISRRVTENTGERACVRIFTRTPCCFCCRRRRRRRRVLSVADKRLQPKRRKAQSARERHSRRTTRANSDKPSTNTTSLLLISLSCCYQTFFNQQNGNVQKIFRQRKLVVVHWRPTGTKPVGQCLACVFVQLTQFT